MLQDQICRTTVLEQVTGQVTIPPPGGRQGTYCVSKPVWTNDGFWLDFGSTSPEQMWVFIFEKKSLKMNKHTHAHTRCEDQTDVLVTGSEEMERSCCCWNLNLAVSVMLVLDTRGQQPKSNYLNNYQAHWPTTSITLTSLVFLSCPSSWYPDWHGQIHVPWPLTP